MPKDFGIGASSKRREDVRFLTGEGRYTDDINVAGQAYGYVLRSPAAHATINHLNTEAAKAAPGVLAVLTAADMEGVNPLPCGWQIHSRDGSPMHEPPHPVLATDTIRHIGEPIAFIVAESREQARDAAEMIEMDLAEKPAVVDMRRAIDGSAPELHEGTGNLCFDWTFGTPQEETDAEFDKAAHVTTLELVNQRMIANPMEPRCAIAEFERHSGMHTVHVTSQNPHLLRLLMCAFVMGIPEHKMRVVALDVGGGFGTKIFQYNEEILCLVAAKKLNRPVKWTSDRGEAFVSDRQGRDHVTKIEVAMDDHGKFLAMRTDTLANLGAYLSTLGPAIPTILHGTLMAGNYTTPKITTNVKGVFTNTVPVDAYRGAGRPEATYQLERLVDKAAREMGLSPIEIRRRNFIQPDQFPYETPVALAYDTGNYDATLDKVLEISDHAGFEARRKESAARGMLRGYGLASYIEACGIAPSAAAGALGGRAGGFESAAVRVNAAGGVVVWTGSHSHGQGHETSFAQVVADMLGIPEDQVEIVHGDTNEGPMGLGTYGSRSLAVGGSAIVRATEKVIDKARKIAAHMLEASESDIEFKDGTFSVTGTDKSLAFGEVALSAYVPHNFPHDRLEPGLEEQSFYDPANFTFPAGAYACEVEVDPDTGKTTVLGFWAADDFGNVINPMIVEGQVQGGVAQGLGQALLEHCVYDEEGQLLSGSYMDYAMPRADDIPNVVVDDSCQTPCTHNPLGVKGCGEAGAIGSPPALVNAVIDALHAGGMEVAHIDMPLTPARVWGAMNAAKG